MPAPGCLDMHETASQIEGIHSVPAGLEAAAEWCARATPVAVDGTIAGSAQRCCRRMPDPAAAAVVVVAAGIQSKSAVGSDSDSAGEGSEARPVRKGCNRD